MAGDSRHGRINATDEMKGCPVAPAAIPERRFRHIVFGPAADDERAAH
jgi:hypothetical protein